MSENEQKSVASTSDSGMVVGGGKQSRRPRAHLKLWVSILCVIIVLGGLIWAVYANIINRSSTPNSSSGPVKVTMADITQLDQQSNDAIAAGNSQKALAVYTQAMPNAANRQVLYELDLGAADVASNAGMFKPAIQYAMGAESINPSAENCALIASVYQQEGNIPQAVNYYKKAATVKSPVRDESAEPPSYYLAKAQALSGGKQ